MSWIDTLKELFSVGAAEKMDAGQGFFMLKENDRHADLSRVDIIAPAESVLVRLDAFPQPKRFFRDDKGARRRCDYALFSKIGGKQRIFFIELKSGRVAAREVTMQLKGGSCVVDYCNSILNNFYGQNDMLGKSFERRYVCLYKRDGKRPAGGPRPKAEGRSPESFHKHACQEKQKIYLESLL